VFDLCTSEYELWLPDDNFPCSFPKQENFQFGIVFAGSLWRKWVS
jgi:hypothetical protein